MDQIAEFFAKLLSTDGFPARWHCGSWSGFLGWLTILSDSTIWLAYFLIPIVLVLFIQKRKDLPFLPVFWLFGAFIVLCGTTHIIDVVIFWAPIYRISALVRAITAVVSMFTLMKLIQILPQAMSLKSAQAFDAEKEKRIEAERDLEVAEKEIEELRKRLANGNA